VGLIISLNCVDLWLPAGRPGARHAAAGRIWAGNRGRGSMERGLVKRGIARGPPFPSINAETWPPSLTLQNNANAAAEIKLRLYDFALRIAQAYRSGLLEGPCLNLAYTFSWYARSVSL
jgi:hypothetical protein